MKIRISKLDKLFSEFIRKRAVLRVNGCEKCLKPMRWKNLENSHFHGRGQKSVRFDPDNCAGLCFTCHRYLQEHPLEHVDWFRKHLGEDDFYKLNIRAALLGIPDESAIEIYYKMRLKEYADIF